MFPLNIHWCFLTYIYQICSFALAAKRRYDSKHINNQSDLRFFCYFLFCSRRCVYICIDEYPISYIHHGNKRIRDSPHPPHSCPPPAALRTAPAWGGGESLMGIFPCWIYDIGYLFIEIQLHLRLGLII